MKQIARGVIVAAALILVFIVGRASCGNRSPLMMDVEFVPKTATDRNPWGDISRIETYYLRNGIRILHGECFEFRHDAGSCLIEIFEDGVCVASKSGPSPYFPIY